MKQVRLLLLSMLLLPGLPVRVAEEPTPFANAVALRVNGQPVGLREVIAAFDDSWRLIQERAARGELKPDAVEQAVREEWREALQTVIRDTMLDVLAEQHRERIIYYFVARFDPATPPSRVMDSFRRLEGDEVRRLRTEMVNAAGGEDELNAALKRKGQTMREWESGLRRELFRREVVYMSLGYIGDSPRLAREYFDRHPEEFNRPDAWRLRRIRIPKDRFGSEEAAVKAAQLIHDRLTQGHDFRQLAASLGYDPPHDQAGGLLMLDGKPDQPSGTFPDEERIAAGLKDGEISEPVNSGNAVLIVKREGYREGLKPTFEQVADKASALAYSARVKAKKEEFFAKQKHDSLIEVLIKDPPEMYLSEILGRKAPTVEK